MRRRVVLALMVLALALLSLGGRLGTRVVHAAQTWNVLVGTDGDQIPGGGSLTTIGFWPTVVTINAGDTVSWTFPSAEPHGVAFEAGQQVPFAFQDVQDPSTGEDDISAIFLPQNLDQVNGVFRPDVPFASGVPQEPPDQRQPFTLTFNTPGTYPYDCQVHGPPMPGVIVVVPAGTALSATPDQVAATGQRQIQGALGGAAGALSQAPPSVGTAVAATGGSSVIPAIAGVEPWFRVAALSFFPNSLTVHRGDTVVFTVADPQEIHTVTFLSGAPEPPVADIRPQPNGPPKIVFPAVVNRPSGGNVYTGSGYLNSGVLIPGASFVVTFNAAPGTYQFQCLIHGDAPQNMKGAITIVP